MSNGDPTIIQIIYRYIFGWGKSSAVTSRKNEVILKPVQIKILEMEDVLFHLNSAVMMPENPKGKSSSDGEMSSTDESLDITGLKALAIVYKQFEFDPNNRIVISGHTDSSDTPEFNFKLSEKRAKSILFLLIGTKEEWAKICCERHKIEDYQQIMKYFEKKLVCGCDPGKVDNAWGDKTKLATEKFFKKMIPANATTLLARVEGDSKKRWPEEAWYPVYELYSEEIAEVLEISLAQLEIYRKTLIYFVEDSKPFVGCGESFPIEAKEKSNYRSQRNRRVDIVFFDKDEVPINKYGQREISCPTETKNVHKVDECPLWRKFYFVPLYIDPKDLKSVVYHLQFVYYDKIKKKQLPVPDGLKINAYEDGHKGFTTENIYKNGVYYVKVQFGNKIKDSTRTQFYFEYETTDKWIYTKDDKTDPVIVTKTNIEITELTFAERQNYYDLPSKWSSRNYWTRYDGDFKKGERFEKVFFDNTFADSLKLKPFDGDITKIDKPLVFSLDDIVLIDANGKQNLQDKDEGGSLKPLSEHSRISLLYLDENDDYRIKVHKPNENEPYFSDIDGNFQRNLITDCLLDGSNNFHSPCRVILFCNDFYDLYNKRTENVAGFDDNNHILGTRAATIIHEKSNPASITRFSEVSCTRPFSGFDASRKDYDLAYTCNGAGNFDLLFLHNCNYSKNSKIYSALILYWSCRFKFGVGGINPDDKNNYTKEGLLNATKRIGLKNYQYEKFEGSEDIIIKPYSLFVAKQDYDVGGIQIKRGGEHKCMVDLVEDQEGSSMGNNTGQLRHSAYKEEDKHYQSDPADPPDQLNTKNDYDVTTTKRLTVAHELTHASGLDDEYAYPLDYCSPCLRYEQYYPGMPYVIDELSLMNSNHAIRMRHCWSQVNWINDESKPGGALNSFLKNTKFKITLQGDAFTKLEFELTNNNYRDIYKPAYSEERFSYANNSASSLFLYKLGNDEFANLITNGQKYDAILIVTPFILFEFIDGGIKASEKWIDGATLNYATWLTAFNRRMETMLNNKFRLKCTIPYSKIEKDFNNIFIRFAPCYDAKIKVGLNWRYLKGYKVEEKTHIKIKVVRDGSSNLESKGSLNAPFNASSLGLEVGDKTDQNRIIRQIFGNTESVFKKIKFFLGISQKADDLKKEDFNLIKTWIKNEIGATHNFDLIDIV